MLFTQEIVVFINFQNCSIDGGSGQNRPSAHKPLACALSVTMTVDGATIGRARPVASCFSVSSPPVGRRGDSCGFLAVRVLSPFPLAVYRWAVILTSPMEAPGKSETIQKRTILLFL